MVGMGLWALYDGRAFPTSDAIFSTFIIEELPPGITGLLIAGVFAAAMSSLSSSINALASASTYDFRPAARRGDEGEEARMLRRGRLFTLLWSAALIGGAILFIPLSRGTPAVEVALAVAGVVYGGLLGAFLLALRSRRATGRSVNLGVAVGVVTVGLIWFFFRAQVAWPWFALIGASVTWVVGHLSGVSGGAGADPQGRGRPLPVNP